MVSTMMIYTATTREAVSIMNEIATAIEGLILEVTQPREKGEGWILMIVCSH